MNSNQVMDTTFYFYLKRFCWRNSCNRFS